MNGASHAGSFYHQPAPMDETGAVGTTPAATLHYARIAFAPASFDGATSVSSMGKFQESNFSYDAALSDLIATDGSNSYQSANSPASATVCNGQHQSSTDFDGDGGFFPNFPGQNASETPALCAGGKSRLRRCSGGTTTKRKYKNPQAAVQQRRQANMRERKRMQSINDAFEKLRYRIPTLPYEKKLSKVDTLKLTINYIQFLKELIENDDLRKNGPGGDGTEKGATPGENENSKINAPNRIAVIRNRNLCSSSTAAQQQKKIIIDRRTAPTYEEELSGVPPLRGHSLSWSRVGEQQPHSLLSAKLWLPQSQANNVTQPQQEAVRSEMEKVEAKFEKQSCAGQIWYDGPHSF